MAPNDETSNLRSGTKRKTSEENPTSPKAAKVDEEKKEIKLDRFNINFALVKTEEVKSFRELKDHPVVTLQGIGPKASAELEKLGLKTIQQMADYKFYHLAKCIKTLAETEETGNRLESSTMNLDKGLIKEFEPYAFKDLLDQPIHALQGLSEAADKTFGALGVKSIQEFADFKYFHWAEAIVTAAKWEE